MAGFKDADWVLDRWLEHSIELEDSIAGITTRLLQHVDHPNVLFSLSTDMAYTRRLQLDMIVCLERYHGHASRFMQALCDDCDEHVLQLDLQAAAFECDLDLDGEEPLSQQDLVEWYEGFGFVEHNEGLGEVGYWMRRMPQL